ncbi:MAG: serine/threonine-protein kinase, partial [Vicinamibacteria bacterium]
RALPDDLLREASRRLGVMSLLGAALWVVGSGLDHLAMREMSHGRLPWAALQTPDVIAGTSVLLSVALYLYTRKSTRNPRVVLDMGLGYMVLTALALGLMTHWHPVPADWPVRPEIGWVGAVVLMFAAIVPSPPAKTLLAGLIAASMNPASMLIAKARGSWDFGPSSNALLMHYPDFILVGVAVVISHVVTKLGREVTKAREMGSYQLGALLGRGGMGEVYRANHRMLARPAAIKLIRPERLGATDSATAQLMVKRFRREAQAAANLSSPHTVAIYDFGVTADQTLYCVMELLDGLTLESLVREHGPTHPGRVVHILRQVCQSLEEAHLRGLVHRDIKPANIHLGRSGLRYDFIKVLDFGLVKTVEAGAGGDSLATSDGQILGTPAYMAPEMALGEAVDGRADLYALGCVAYYMLSGQVIFEGEKAIQVIAKHLRTDPIPPSQRASIPLPPGLEQLVLACVAKKPADRPQSAADLSRSLAALEVEPWSETQAAEWWTAYRPAQPGGPAPTGLAGAAGDIAGTMARLGS